MHENPEVNVTIEGHCDERGSDEYNLALGERRAKAVKSYLAALGIAPDRLSTISYGEEMPATVGRDESAWSKNRRAEFK
jgi:peptidoglycan-associated lipoprotein